MYFVNIRLLALRSGTILCVYIHILSVFFISAKTEFNLLKLCDILIRLCKFLSMWPIKLCSLQRYLFLDNLQSSDYVDLL